MSTSAAEAAEYDGACHAAGVPHRLHVWLIGNPTSGAGRGGEMLAELTGVLECEAGSVALVHHLVSSALPSDLCLCCPSAHYMSSQEGEAGRQGRNDERADVYVPAFSATVIATDSADCGPAYVAARVADCIVRDRLASTAARNGASDENSIGDHGTLHVVLVVGGDGSLGEAVDGLCKGTLQAYEQWSRAHTTAGSAQDVLPAFTASPPQWLGPAPSSDEDDKRTSSASHLLWRLRARSVLRHLLPPVLYIPSGTGADFAKLQLCCRNVAEVRAVLHGVRTYLEEKKSTIASPSCTTRPCGDALQEEDKESVEPAFVCYEVDVGRVGFVRSHKVRHFINECSLGMSCDVVRRSARLRRRRLMTMAGGMVIFGWAAIESLLATRPQRLRIARLPGSPPLPSRVASHTCASSAAAWAEAYKPRPVHVGQLPCHVRSAHCALHGMRSDAQWCQEQLLHSTGVQEHKARNTSALHLGCEERLVQQALAGSTTTVEQDETGQPDRRAALDLCLTQPSSCSTQCNETAEDHCGACDGCGQHRWVSMPSSTLAFGNGRWYGGGLHVTPHADPTDNLLSCTNWVTSVLPFLGGVRSLYNGRHTAWPSTTAFDGERFLVDEEAEACSTKTLAATRGEEKENNNTNGTRNDASNDDSDDDEGIFVEADGELLDTLPAIVEVASSVCLLAPRVAPAFGAPLPGSGRAALYTPRASSRGNSNNDEEGDGESGQS